MSIGVQGFDQLEVTLSEHARNKCRGNAARLAQMEEDTRRAVEHMLSAPGSNMETDVTPPTRIDADATIILSHRRSTPFEGTLIDMMLRFGRNGEALFEKILKDSEDPDASYNNPKNRFVKGTKSRLWQAADRAHQVDYLGSLIAHPKINIEALNASGSSLLNHFCASLAARDNPSRAALGGQLTSFQVNAYIHQLLNRGAVLNPEFADLVMSQPQKSPLLGEALKPHLDAWNQEWQRFERKEIVPATMTNEQFAHFFSLGKTEAMIRSGHWDGCYEDLLLRLHELPEWVAEQCPMHTEYTILFAKMAPTNRVWNSTLAQRPPDTAAADKKQR